MKKSHVIAYGFAVLMVIILVTWSAYAIIHCEQVKAEYENNLPLSIEKYGFQSFEEWKITNEVSLGNDCRFKNSGNGPLP